jgi:hypothetical protein
MMKTLITSGCSFSECISSHLDTWPRHLAQELPDYTHISKAMGSQGNGLISRSIIYQVSNTLKTSVPEDILVGIMWSGVDRHDYYRENPPPMENIDRWMTNPTKFIPESKGGWLILNNGWRIEEAKNYYVNFHDYVGAMIVTLEHILRVQWFLKANNIRYFMSTYTSEVLPDWIKTHVDTQHLYDQIDFDHFLPVKGEDIWCREYFESVDYHPSTEQHQAFTKQVIIPFIKDRRYI